MEFLQQFGDVASSMIAGLCIVLLDRSMRRRMLDWIVGALATWLAVWIVKVSLGRPRPKIVFESPKAGFDGAVQFTPPWGTYPLPRTDGAGVVGYLERHAWEFWSGISSDLWSMPSSHTSAAAALAVGLGTMYGKLRPLMWSLVVVVGVSRVLTGSHFPSDVVLGAGLGYCVATLSMGGRWGQRLFSRATRG
ncbi:undecaprenyl-diphosphatase [Phycisphaerales bacterium]|nr:undecaprenyl-diphosphatase [Phycisphaerales bacterium]